MGFVPTWGFLALCRVLLGVFEVSDRSVTECGHFPKFSFVHLARLDSSLL
jgi:hypothetical protein